ncbi:nucleotidyltransferase domain-containing protein (plasmid) [Sphingomonas changnyeongensis]|uniref:Nucleotidyltransferase domain-containing protein n=1 Tax=Sphingomonas changnyeongensis TaxID=2698679 RepID=A0A7Z2S6F1_9SPHN|nr:nucleotidyltransferase domain-containing protein [Sphingomonas changnyeongensis]QHL92070.1 nucleotidyltransferase domain-containing protein [Sphingomonas changnyeongensis]
MTSTLPPVHAAFVARILAAVKHHPYVDGLLAGGSFIHGGLDEHSDLDFVLVIDEVAYPQVMNSRMAFAQSLGTLISAFSGEHVGEPRLLICLYGPPLLHVDLKFVTASDLDHRIEMPAVLFARDRERIAAQLGAATIAWPNMSPDWFEARAWIWLHYAATKLLRGELFEAVGMLSFFREQVLGPMLYRRAGLPQRGVRRIEMLGLDGDKALASTAPQLEAASVRAALLSALNLYLQLRADAPPQNATDGMPSMLLSFLGADLSCSNVISVPEAQDVID